MRNDRPGKQKLTYSQILIVIKLCAYFLKVEDETSEVMKQVVKRVKHLLKINRIMKR